LGVKQSLDGENLGMQYSFVKKILEKLPQMRTIICGCLAQRALHIGNAEAQHLDYYFAAVWAPESGIDELKGFEHYLMARSRKN